MTTKPQIGKNQYKDALRRGREGTQVMRDALRRLLEENLGPQARATLITRMALACGNIEAVFTELDEFGRQMKTPSGD